MSEKNKFDGVSPDFLEYDNCGRPVGFKKGVDPDKVKEKVEEIVNEKKVEAPVEPLLPEPPVEEKVEPVDFNVEVEEKAKETAKAAVDASVKALDAVVSNPEVKVELPKNTPQIVEVVAPAEKIEENKVTLELKDATVEVSDDVVLDVIPTPDEKSDIVVAIKPEVKEALEAKNVDILDAVETSLATTESIPDAKVPEATEDVVVKVEASDETGPEMTVTTPKVITSVVDLKVGRSKKNPAVTILPVTSVPKKAKLYPALTGRGKPDVVLAITPDDQERLDERGVVNMVKIVEKALIKADVDVEAVVDVSKLDLEAATDVPSVLKKIDELSVGSEVVSEPATEDDDSKPVVVVNKP